MMSSLHTSTYCLHLHRVKMMRVRGGRYKARALRLNFANFAWRSENFSAKTRLLDVVYHPANYEYVRTKTLTKSAIVTVDATPFRVWYRNHFNVDLAEGEEKKLEFKVCVISETILSLSPLVTIDVISDFCTFAGGCHQRGAAEN